MARFFEAAHGPDFDLDSEANVLAACFDRPAIVHDIRTELNEDDFCSIANRSMWRAILEITDAGNEIGRELVWAWFCDHDCVGNIGADRDDSLRYLVRIADETPDYSLRIRPFVERVRDKARMRRAKITANRIIASMPNYEGNTQAFIDRAVEAFREIADRKEMTNLMHVSDVLAEKFIQWANVKAGRTTSGYTTGFEGLNRIIGGLRPSSLVVLAARPGAGKTALGLNMAMRLAAYGAAVAVFSMEMARDELVDRQLADLSGIPVGLVKSGAIESAVYTKNLDDAVGVLKTYPVWIDDTANTAIVDIRAKVKRLKSELKRRGGQLGLVVVDYVGLMQEPIGSKSREQAVASNTRNLKLLAKQEDVPVLLLAQMNREIEKRSGRPKLSDLRESGAIEQDADVVLFIHRTETECELIVAKNRHGGCGDVKLVYRGELTRFEEPDGEWR